MPASGKRQVADTDQRAKRAMAPTARDPLQLWKSRGLTLRCSDACALSVWFPAACACKSSWQGTCSLIIDEEGNAQGSYVSDQSKSVYPVRGQISGLPHRLTFELELANATQSFEAFLWTK